MLVMRRVSGEREEERADRLDCMAELGAREGYGSCFPREVLVKKSNSVKLELVEKRKGSYSLLVSLQLKQNKLEQVEER